MSKLYLHDAAKDTSGGTYPSGEQSTSTANVTWPGASTLRTMNGTIGTAQVNQEGTTLGSTAEQKHFARFFCSMPLASAQTIGGGTWAVNLSQHESSTAANFGFDGVNAYVWRPSTGAKVGTCIDTTTGLSAVEASATADSVLHFTFPTSAVSGAAGDVLIVELWATFTQGSTTARFADIYYDGTTENTTTGATVTNHAAFVETSETLTFGTPDTTPPSLSGSANTVTGPTTADVKVTTDEGNGTLYVVVTASGSPPTATQIKNGEDELGAAAAFASSQAVSSTGEKTFNATGLTASTVYYPYFVQSDAASNTSSVLSGNQFTTNAASVTGAALLTQAVNTATGAGVAPVVGTASPTQAGQTSSAAGAAPVVGTSSQTQAGQTVTAAGTAAVVGAASLTQAGQAAGGAGVAPVVGSGSPAQADDTLAATGAGQVSTSGSASLTQASQTASGPGVAPVAGTGSPAQASDSLAAAGAAPVAGAASITQALQTLAAAGAGETEPVSGDAALTQDRQTVTSAGIASAEDTGECLVFEYVASPGTYIGFRLLS